MQKMIDKIVAASLVSGDGSVNAVIEVDWKFVVTVALEKDEIATLDEESLRNAVGAQVDESVDVTKDTGEAIEIGALLETRDGDTDEMIETVDQDNAASDLSLLELVANVLDRLASGENFNKVIEETGVTAKVRESLK